MQDEKNAMDILAGVITFGVLADLVSFLVGILAAIWYIIRLYEWYQDRKEKKNGDVRKHRLDS